MVLILRGIKTEVPGIEILLISVERKSSIKPTSTADPKFHQTSRYSSTRISSAYFIRKVKIECETDFFQISVDNSHNSVIAIYHVAHLSLSTLFATSGNRFKYFVDTIKKNSTKNIFSTLILATSQKIAIRLKLSRYIRINNEFSSPQHLYFQPR